MSAAEGIRRSSITSTVTTQPSSAGSTPLTPSGSLPVSSAMCRSPDRPASAAVSCSVRPRLVPATCCSRSSPSLSPRVGRRSAITLASCRFRESLGGRLRGHQPACRLLLYAPHLFLREVSRCPLPLRLLEFAPDRRRIVDFPLNLLLDQLRDVDYRLERQDGKPQ